MPRSRGRGGRGDGALQHGCKSMKVAKQHEESEASKGFCFMVALIYDDGPAQYRHAKLERMLLLEKDAHFKIKTEVALLSRRRPACIPLPSSLVCTSATHIFSGKRCSACTPRRKQVRGSPNLGHARCITKPPSSGGPNSTRRTGCVHAGSLHGIMPWMACSCNSTVQLLSKLQRASVTT